MEDSDLRVRWDPDRLEQVFLNVIKNAMEALENGGNLLITAKTVGDKVRITVKDDGCGIPKAHMDKIYKSFFSTKSSGTGLGLIYFEKICGGSSRKFIVRKKRGGQGDDGGYPFTHSIDRDLPLEAHLFLVKTRQDESLWPYRFVRSDFL